jgi:hypothetical protein
MVGCGLVDGWENEGCQVTNPQYFKPKNGLGGKVLWGKKTIQSPRDATKSTCPIDGRQDERHGGKESDCDVCWNSGNEDVRIEAMTSFQ